MTPFLIGSLNRKGPYFHATGEGVISCVLDETTGEIHRVAATPNAENAIWLARSVSGVLVASEHYLEAGSVSAWRFESDGILLPVGQAQSSLGGAICHIAVSAENRTAIVSNYLGGVTVHALGVDGAVAPAHQHICYAGHGVNQIRQDKSHPHQAALTPDNSHVLVCDLGCDRVWVHGFDGKSLGDAVPITVSPGSGPRHLVFHPTLPRFYLFGELDAKVRVFEGGGADWREIDVQDTLPEGFNGEPAGAGIRLHCSGKALFAANRNCDSIASFAIDVQGDLERHATFPCQGKTPRDIVLSPSGHWLLCVNQDSHQVIAFELDPISGLPTGKSAPPFACGSPVCGLF
jgi:6-phosphogluconolactonase